MVSLLVLSVLSVEADSTRQPAEEIIAVGSARILKGSTIAAKESAVRDALTKALEINILKKLGQKTVADNFNVLVTQIFPVASDLTASYQVLAEDRGKEILSVLVSVKVNSMILEERLKKAGVSISQESSKRVILLISEISEASGKSLYWWGREEYGLSLTSLEAALYGSLQEMGVAGTNRMGRFSWASVLETMKKEQLTDDGVIAWGNLIGADVAVYGKARMSGGKVASIEIGIYDVFSSSMISKELISHDSLREVSAAAKDAAGRIAGAMGAGFAGKSGAMNELRAVFESVSGAGQLQKLAAFLNKDVQGVKRAVPLKLSKNSVSFLIEFQGDTERFRSAILKNSALPYKLDFLRGDKNEVVFRLIEPSVQ